MILNNLKITFFKLMILSLIVTGCHDQKTPVEPPGGGPEPTILPFYFNYPAWHPHSEWIAVEHSDSVDTNGDGIFDKTFGGIWLVHAQTAEKQPLIRDFGNPAWSPDGRLLAMERGAQIFTVEVSSLTSAHIDTNSLVQLTTEGRNFFPAWSPDGEWVAYDSNLNDSVGANVIWKMRFDGSEKTDISKHGVGEWRMPEWSPTGKHIVHQRYYSDVSSGAPEIVVMDSSGENALRLTIDENGDGYPRYSPDGRYIAFYTASPQGSLIRTINSDRSDLRKLNVKSPYLFDWSPTGDRIVFIRWNLYEPIKGNGELWIVSGTGVRQLTHYSKR